MDEKHHESRLARIEKPPGLFAKFLYFVGRRIFNTVPGAFSVVYVRKPALAKVAITIERTAKKLTIDDELQLLVRAKGSHLRGCAFCRVVQDDRGRGPRFTPGASPSEPHVWFSHIRLSGQRCSFRKDSSSTRLALAIEKSPADAK